MRRGMLSDYFSGVAVKRLSMVEVSQRGNGSNQHEFNSSRALKALMGEDDRKGIPARFVWLGEEQEGLSEDSTISWYDSRRRHPTRSEYRLYYPSNPVSEMMQQGDAFFIALRPDGTAMVIVTPAGSTMQNQLVWLFGLDEEPEFEFTFQPIAGDRDNQLDFAARYILDELGIDFEEPDADRLDTLIEPFGLRFPTTHEFSLLARNSLPHVSVQDAPDAALMAWIDREELLFRRLERHIVAQRLRGGFMAEDDSADVDGFLSFSLSVQNRRKSRAGQSLENHLEALFGVCGIRFARGAVTENRNKPDFLFPGAVEYHDPMFPAARLTMLASKSTLKDRWRQVLPEAQRIPDKHLFTLEPGISENQTTQMQAERLQLVIPQGIHATYRETQRQWLMTIGDFIRLADGRQQ
jgi:hypothetical protein